MHEPESLLAHRDTSVSRDEIPPAVRSAAPLGDRDDIRRQQMEPLRQAAAFCLDSPPNAPKALWMIYSSGAAELIRAVGLLTRARWSEPASAALLVAVLPVNVRHALDVTASSEDSGRWKTVLAWARVPMQIPLIWAALQNRRATNLSL